MFGRGSFQAGVIVDPKAAFKFDPSDFVRLAEFRNKIWWVKMLCLQLTLKWTQADGCKNERLRPAALENIQTGTTNILCWVFISNIRLSTQMILVPKPDKP